MKLRAFVCVGVMVAALAACSTSAQKQFISTRELYNSAIAQRTFCLKAAAQTPAYSPLVDRLPLAGDGPSLIQMASDDTPSIQDVAILVSWHRDVEQCRIEFLNQAQRSFPFMTTALEQNASEMDDILLQLVKREITWGAANRLYAKARVDAQHRTAQAGNVWVKELKEENRDELDRRQQAVANFQQSMHNLAMEQAARAQANASIYHSPVFTTCQNYGSTTSCTSQ